MMLAPGGRIGILGGGQLGRMLAQAAVRLGFDALIFAPEENPPAAQAAPFLRAEYTDESALARFCAVCDVITYEFENIPLEACAFIVSAGKATLHPSVKALEVARNRLNEKNFLVSLDLPPAPFAGLESGEEIIPALAKTGLPAILKTQQGGYDGKGQIQITNEAEAEEARKSLSGAAVLEQKIPFIAEAALIAARGKDGAFSDFDLTRTYHEDGILRRAEAGNLFAPELVAEASEMTEKIMAALDYRGVMAVEFFIGADGELWINEIAPRVHNSGHWTLEACVVSQFEQHIRAIAGWPLGDSARLADARMENLIGADAENWRDLASDGKTALHLYGKKEIRDGRKMGHITRLYPLGALSSSRLP